MGQLTYGKRQWESLDVQMRQLIPVFDKASQDMMEFVDADTNAFNDYMTALKMPKNDEKREKAMQDGLKKAVQVPLALAETASKLFVPFAQLAEIGNINCKSDLQVTKKSF